MDESALARVEQQRSELENNIDQLRKSLRHWQTLEIDYESLKEEFQGIPEDSSAEECLHAARESRLELVNETELQALLRDNNSRARRPAQLVELLSKRVDYVARNVQTVQKQLSDAEKKRNALLLMEEPDHRDDAGLPLAEITEELDDSGQIVSSKVENPGATAPQLIDVLKKVGITDLKEMNGTVTKVDASKERETETPHPSIPSFGTSNLEETSKIESSSQTLPTYPTDTEDEAKLRREMLEYSRGLDEIGAIVAELDLQEEGSDISYDEMDDAFELDSALEDDEDFDEDESEDEVGKTKTRLTVPRGYRKRMEDLQEKLGLKNLGPEDAAQRPPAAEAARKAAIARYEKSTKSSLKSPVGGPGSSDEGFRQEKRTKKKVAFSSELDINTDPVTMDSSAVPSRHHQKASETPRVRPINESVVERTVVDNDDKGLTPTRKPSKFKATRQSLPQTPMSAPPMTLPSEGPQEQGQLKTPTPPSRSNSSDLVERPSPNVSQAPSYDDFSDEAHRREIAVEYQRHRIKRIHSQEGGFVGDGEDDYDDEITSPGGERAEGEAQGRKVSRFKAARIHR